MPDTPLPPPFEAYVGQEPYLFASYAHLDGPAVFPELTYLRDQGYRIWYDEGIDPGNEWPEEVAKALAGASFFLVFVSPSAVKSQNVRNEINYALNNRKPFLAIHIAETELPPGLQLRMGDIQAVMKYRMTDDSYSRKLGRTLPEWLRSAEVLEENEMEARKTDEVLVALRRVAEIGDTWSCGLATVWRADHTSLIIRSWDVVWDDIAPTVSKRFDQMAPPRVSELHTETDHHAYAVGIVRANRILRPDTQVSKMKVALANKPQFIPPWHNCKHMGLGEVDFECKQCGYDGFSLGRYDGSDRVVPNECPKCALGRDMPEDTKKY